MNSTVFGHERTSNTIGGSILGPLRLPLPTTASTRPTHPTASATHSTASLSSKRTRPLYSIVHSARRPVRVTIPVVTISILCKPPGKLFPLLNTIEREAPIIASRAIGIFPDNVTESVDILDFLGVGVFVEAMEDLVVEDVDVSLELGIRFLA